MASAKVSVGGLGILDRLAKINLGDEFEKALDTALEQGEDAMKEAIATRGTGRQWSRPWGDRTGSFPGRVDSGDMQSDVRGVVTSKTNDSAEGNLGWDENSPDYYAYQEQGFEHVITGEYIEGMRALRDSAELTKTTLIQEVEDIARRI